MRKVRISRGGAITTEQLNCNTISELINELSVGSAEVVLKENLLVNGESRTHTVIYGMNEGEKTPHLMVDGSIELPISMGLKNGEIVCDFTVVITAVQSKSGN